MDNNQEASKTRQLFSYLVTRDDIIADLIFGLSAYFITPWIVKAVSSVKTGNSHSLLGLAILFSMLLEFYSLHILLFTMNSQSENKKSGVGWIFLWIAHFAMTMMLGEIMFPALANLWSNRVKGILQAVIIIKEFYYGGLFFYFGERAETGEAPQPLSTQGNLLKFSARIGIAIFSFLTYASLWQATNGAEQLTGIKAEMADVVPYLIFHYSLIFLVIYIPSRAVDFLVTRKPSISMPGFFGRNLKRASLLIATLGGISGLLQGPNIPPKEMLEVRNKSGRTALLVHVEYAPLHTLKGLLKEGANINAQDMNGNTALHIASTTGRYKAVSFLLDEGADASVKNLKGETALIAAINRDYPALNRDAIITLIEKKAAIEVRDVYEQTPVIRAACMGDDFAIEALIKVKADLNTVDSINMTAMECARRNANNIVVNLLKGAGVKK